MKLLRIMLKNFRLFQSLECMLHPDLTVLVSENGGGKTSILDAISIAMGAYIESFQVGKVSGIAPSDAFSPVDSKAFGQAHPFYPVIVSASATLDNDVTQTWSMELFTHSNTINMNTSALFRYAESLQMDTESSFIWPLLAYYGTNRDRVWGQVHSIKPYPYSIESKDRAMGYIDYADTVHRFRYFIDWFHHVCAYSTQLKTGAFSPLVDAVRRAVDTVLAHSGWGHLNYSDALQELTLTHEKYGVLEVRKLGDGIRTVTAMVSDLAFRAVQLNAHLGDQAVLKTTGVVLIDAVDMHLHPSWQQTILSGLRDAFPRLQFIVTTHSPQVLSTVKRENIRIIGPNHAGELIAEPPLAMTYGEHSDGVMHSVMRVDPQPPVQEKPALQRLTELVDQGAYASKEAYDLMQMLTLCFGVQHPQLQRLQHSIQRQTELAAGK